MPAFNHPSFELTRAIEIVQLHLRGLRFQKEKFPLLAGLNAQIHNELTVWRDVAIENFLDGLKRESAHHNFPPRLTEALKKLEPLDIFNQRRQK